MKLPRLIATGVALCNPVLSMTSGSVMSTVYVSRHFEVRDHEQPTKYVFNGSTRVAHVIGSISANARLQRLQLLPGWNLCSLAVTGPFPASGAESISSAYQWNQTTGSYSVVSAAQTLAAGTVLWVKARTNATISVLGAYSDPGTEQLQAGGTYLPCPGLEAWTTSFPPSLSIWLYDPEGNEWHSQLAGNLMSLSNLPAVLSPGQAVYVEPNAPVSLAMPDPTLRICYYHEDHLGSSSSITDAQGALVEETAFYPFGLPRHQTEPRQVRDPYQFTQKERDPESGLNYFEARYLDTSAEGFISTDAKYADPDKLPAAELTTFLASPQQINLYAYARSNPLKYLDPTGLGPMDYMIPKTKEEYDRDKEAAEAAFAAPGKAWRAIRDEYNDIRNDYCFWPVENCNVDWSGTYRHWFKSGSDGNNDKPKPQPAPAPPPQGSGAHAAAGGGSADNPAETQKKVLSVIASLLDDLVGDNRGHTKPPAHSTNPPHSSQPGRRPPDQPRKYFQMELEEVQISHFQDSASP